MQLQEIFAEDWYFATERDPIGENWFPPADCAGETIVQVVGSGPDTATETIQRLFFAAVTSAERRVLLTTPYFVPDESMVVALETAALKGVDVRLLLPSLSDSRLVLHAGRSYYQELLNSGVRIYEYQPAILHAKTMVVDEDWATVGSANMDVRSFRLNFEVNAVIYGSTFTGQLAKVFETDLTSAREVCPEELQRKPLGQRTAEGLARILSPVL
jgi:cardiolipin synthase